MCTSGAYSGLNYFAFYMPLAKTSFVSEELLLELKASIDKRKTAYYQIFCGLAYLHSLYIIHADIKPDNILVFKKGGKYVYKIIDFGLSKTSSYLGLEYSLNVGTAEWKAPEIFDYLYSNTHVGHISSAVDIWSMGVIIYDIIYQNSSGLFASSSLKILGQLAQLHGLYIEIDTVDPQIIIQKATPYASADSPWRHLGNELLGLSYLKKGDKEKARSSLHKILEDPKVPAAFKVRAQAIINYLNTDQK